MERKRAERRRNKINVIIKKGEKRFSHVIINSGYVEMDLFGGQAQEIHGFRRDSDSPAMMQSLESIFFNA